MLSLQGEINKNCMRVHSDKQREQGEGVSERKGVGEGESGSLDSPHDAGFRRRYPKFR